MFLGDIDCILSSPSLNNETISVLSLCLHNSKLPNSLLLVVSSRILKVFSISFVGVDSKYFSGALFDIYFSNIFSLFVSFYPLHTVLLFIDSKFVVVILYLRLES